MFDSADENKDGLITRAEFVAFIRAQPWGASEDPDRLFDQMDKDADDAVDAQEAFGFCKNRGYVGGRYKIGDAVAVTFKQLCVTDQTGPCAQERFSPDGPTLMSHHIDRRPLARTGMWSKSA